MHIHTYIHMCVCIYKWMHISQKLLSPLGFAYFVLCDFRFDHLALDNELGGLSSEKSNFILSVAVNCSS